MVNKKNRTFIFIDNDDFDKYKKLSQSHYFKGKKNIDLFAIATLVGIHSVKDSLPLDNSNKKDYIRVNDNKNKESMIILKSLAISEFNNANILADEEKLFSYCENYANSGIKELYLWYSDNNFDFDQKIAKLLLEFWDIVDLDDIKS